MPSVNDPNPVENSVLVTVHFTKPNAAPGYGMGFVVRFAVAPKVGDNLDVDQYSIKRIPEEDLHQSYWTIVAVTHDLNLDTDDDEGEKYPLATLYVVAHPRHEKTQSASVLF